MNLILLEREEVTDASRVVLSGPRARHIIDVLHAQPRQTIRVGIVDGPFGIGTVEDVAAESVTLRCELE